MKHLAFVAVFGLGLIGLASAQGLSASAFLTASQNGAIWNYDIHLTNTGTTTIGTFWYSWIPGMGFLPDPPTVTGNPGTWGNGTVTDNNKAILWVANSLLNPGQSIDGFTFSTIDSPTVLSGMNGGHAIGTSFVYHTGPFSDSGFMLVANPVPEPATFAVLGLGAIALVRRRRRA